MDTPRVPFSVVQLHYLNERPSPRPQRSPPAPLPRGNAKYVLREVAQDTGAAAAPHATSAAPSAREDRRAARRQSVQGAASSATLGGSRCRKQSWRASSSCCAGASRSLRPSCRQRGAALGDRYRLSGFRGGQPNPTQPNPEPSPPCGCPAFSLCLSLSWRRPTAPTPCCSRLVSCCGRPMRDRPSDRGGLPQLCSPREVRLALGVSESTLYRLRRNREFPAPIRLSRSRIGWRREVVEAWLAAPRKRPRRLTLEA
jgi:predicted DNA-binding transcriptional regulator AlpA